MHYVDLFSGIGGFAFGAYLARCKFENHYFSEIDPYCIKLYKQRFPEAIYLGDITTYETWQLPAGEYAITGGFPCQDISLAGKGDGIDGDRSGLWFTMWRIIRLLQPRYTIIENVPAITSRGLDRILSNLAEIGYNAEWQNISASDMGAPHRRERIWIVAYPTSFSCDRRNKNITRQAAIPRQRFDGNPRRWATEPNVGRLAYGVPNRVDRLRGLGNAILPQIAALLFRLIHETI